MHTKYHDHFSLSLHPVLDYDWDWLLLFLLLQRGKTVVRFLLVLEHLPRTRGVLVRDLIHTIGYIYSIHPLWGVYGGYHSAYLIEAA